MQGFVRLQDSPVALVEKGVVGAQQEQISLRRRGIQKLFFVGRQDKCFFSGYCDRLYFLCHRIPETFSLFSGAAQPAYE